MDGYQWLLFLAAHTERHIAQIREVQAASGLLRKHGIEYDEHYLWD